MLLVFGGVTLLLAALERFSEWVFEKRPDWLAKLQALQDRIPDSSKNYDFARAFSVSPTAIARHENRLWLPKGPTDGQAGQPAGWPDRQAGRQTDRQSYALIHEWTDVRRAGRQTDRQSCAWIHE
jgi:hypothetical protein